MYQVSSKSPKGFRKSYKNKVFFKENCKSRGLNSLINNWTGLPLQYVHFYNVIFHSIKFHQNPLKSLGGVPKTVFFKENCKSRGYKSLKNNWTGLSLQ
jgi:hypothetical protein